MEITDLETAYEEFTVGGFKLSYVMGKYYVDGQEVSPAAYQILIEKLAPKDLEKIDHPDHYAKGRKFEPIEVIEDWELGFCLGNALKYISRAGRKDDYLNDLLKAKWYLEREIRKCQK